MLALLCAFEYDKSKHIRQTRDFPKYDDVCGNPQNYPEVLNQFITLIDKYSKKVVGQEIDIVDMLCKTYDIQPDPQLGIPDSKNFVSHICKKLWDKENRKDYLSKSIYEKYQKILKSIIGDKYPD